MPYLVPRCMQSLVHAVPLGCIPGGISTVTASMSWNIPQGDGHTLCVQCLGVQHATLALKDEAFCDICEAFQLWMLCNRLARATGTEAQSPVAKPSVALAAPGPPLFRPSLSPSQGIPCAQARTSNTCSHFPSLQARRVMRSKQTRDIMALKAQMAQTLQKVLTVRYLYCG
ncbi:UNVERIFIED_CONTAM: hypothetical protein FKN15_001496 [Acipenser sinensis]